VTQGSSGKPVYRFGEFELNAGDRVLLKSGVRVSLTPRAFDLLHALIRAEGHLVAKEDLLADVWADAVVEEGNLNRTISSLRKALGEVRGEHRYIETVPKAGYRFAASLVGVAQNGRLSDVERTGSEGDRSVGPPKYAWVYAVAAFLLIFGGLIIAFLLSTGGSNAIPSEPRAPAMVRLTNNKFQEDQGEWTSDGQIRFVRFVTATRAESWWMNSDGSNQRRANDEIKGLLTGQRSPDGKRVVFSKDGEGPRNIYLANADGSSERKLPLTYPPADWSPDGTRFVGVSIADKSNAEIFIYDIAADRSTNITNSPFFDTDPVFSPDGKQIAFTSDRDGNREAYVMNVDGSNVRRMTDDPAIDAFPVFSPDGTQLVFDSNRERENVDVYIRNLNDDSPPRKLTQLASNEEHRKHCFSPDGSKLVITSDVGGNSNLYVIQIDVSGPKLLREERNADLQYPSFSPTGDQLIYQARSADRSLAIRRLDRGSSDAKTLFQTTGDVGGLALAPSVSPDGRQIAFANKVEGNTEISLINVDGSDLRNLTNNPSSDASPVFSADGHEIFFHSNRDGAFERFYIYRMLVDGGQQQRATNKVGYEFSPHPVGGGQSLVFAGDREDETSRALDIRIIDLTDGSSETVIAGRQFHDSLPAVSSDGKRVAFVAQSDGNNEIYLVNVDGTGLVRLTHDPADDTTPTFGPDDRSIVFSSDRGGRYAIYRLSL